MQTEAIIVPGAMTPIIRLRQNGSRAGRWECVPAIFDLHRPGVGRETLPAYRGLETAAVLHRAEERAVRRRIGHAGTAPLAAAGIWEWQESGPDKAPLISFALLSMPKTPSDMGTEARNRSQAHARCVSYVSEPYLVASFLLSPVHGFIGTAQYK